MEEANDAGAASGPSLEGFARSLPEDCVEYVVCIVDETLSEQQIREKLKHIQNAGNALVKKHLKAFIWQRESFQLELVRAYGTSILRGRTNFGDSVEDEWLIVYLLRELSLQFPDAWTRLVDNDGEFLLIEAANALPKWLNPEIADNRIWINKGELLIIPLGKAAHVKGGASTQSTNIDMKEAWKQIRRGRSNLLHVRLVEEEAFYRLRNYPKQINDYLHHSLVTIPRKLAHVLHENSAYISPAVEAFYLRDPVALKPLQAAGPDNLAFPPKDFVSMRVTFNKVGFAQTKSQRFPVPKTWINTVPIPEDRKGAARAEVGMKLTCGFEMLVSDPQNQDKKVVREIRLLLEDVESGEVKLPEDAEINGWGLDEDDEKWMDINFEDFDRELEGKQTKSSAKRAGFGDVSAHENLKKMVSRFEDFLNEDEDVSDDMDEDDDSDGGDLQSQSSDGEDKAASFDEDEFTKMMREMMGMPADAMEEIMTGSGKSKRKDQQEGARSSKIEKVDEESDEEEEIQRLSALMEAELRQSGALRLATENKDLSLDDTSRNDGKLRTDEEGENDSDEEVLDVDFNLLQNMMHSFKSQAGLAGPGGNMMGMMGTRLPRDEADEYEDGHDEKES